MRPGPWDRWRAGDLVSEVISGKQTGRLGIVIIDHRLRDSAPYRRVQITEGNGASTKRPEWPSGWVIGRGSLLKVCHQCELRYCTDDRTEVLCQVCNGDERHDESVATVRNDRAYAAMVKSGQAIRRGVPSDPAAIARQKQQDEAENPF